MGYMRHHAIAVTSWDEELILLAHEKALEIFDYVSPVSPKVINGYRSFFIPPDGSKEGWDKSTEGNKRRRIYIEWLNAQRYEDGSSSLQWVEFQFGDDNLETKIINDSDAVMRLCSSPIVRTGSERKVEQLTSAEDFMQYLLCTVEKAEQIEEIKRRYWKFMGR